jgi:hypothetical protein
VFGYPNKDEAFAYCQSFRLSLVAMTGMCFVMHLLAGACAVCITFNADAGRQSLVHEVYDFDAATAFHDVASARSSFAAPNAAQQAAGAGAGGGLTPKPLLSRASTLTGAPAAADSPATPSAYTANPMGVTKA